MSNTAATSMQLTQDARLVQTSWAELEPVADLMMDLFFARLFQLDPDLRELFPNDLRRVKCALLNTLTRVVRETEQSAVSQRDIQNLGRRHLAWGVTAQHYELFGNALVWTCEKGLGEKFTPRTRQAWQSWYAQLVRVMQNANAE